MNEAYHYPPELLLLLVDTIPRLCKSKRDVIIFFRGSGVRHSLLSGIQSRLSNDPNNINKYEMARNVLTGLNEIGDSAIRERREILKRVVEFEDFSACWENDRLEAQGLVARIRDVVNVKDSFTRINQERETELRKHRESQEAKASALRQHRGRMAEIRRDLYSLFAMENPQKRGLLLEGVLNRLFDAEGILVRESFRRVGKPGQGIVEQIDGAVELDGQTYLVEMKWLKNPVSKGDVAEHLVRVFGRNSSRGIFISYSEFSAAAVETCKECLGQAVMVLCTLEELVHLVDKEANVKKFLNTKIQRCIVEKEPFVKVL